ncbi:hypothetical protein [Candidatus Nitrosotenuis uzonensis]|uniref:hypothetical protein n=1 Tax=Candidatus Nitrosotenuis uzonensis TaxID=1407055 RepID=UPI0012DD8EB7|nr:hypothetical protein [Candidatus Nitrosotenuis uzonensis]
MALQEFLGFNDGVTIHNTTHVIDITPSVIFGIFGIIVILLYTKTKLLKFLEKGIARASDPITDHSTPYEQFHVDKLETIRNNILNNYRILITIYGILLAFVISDKISYVFSTWSMIIWLGYTLAVIVRTGMISLDLSDIIETETNLIKLKVRLFAAKKFQKHNLYLLVVTVAFLPVVFLSPAPDIDKIMTLPWGIHITVLASAIAIIGTFLVFYFVPLKTRLFETRGGLFDTYIFVIMLIILSTLSYVFRSPVEQITISFLNNMHVVPGIVLTGAGVIALAGAVACGIFVKGLFGLSRLFGKD